jgi:predicted secreted protein
MKSETALPGLAESTEVSLRPAAGREAPVVWVQALAVHCEWPAHDGTLLREIRLRRGLNILWAQPAPAGTRNRTSGHATGKTTFCRLLRYVLDDADSGTKDFRQRFQKHFPRGGWVFGEVIVDGQRWLVGRPLSPGFHPFALKGGSFADAKGEKPLRGAYEDYQKALDAAAFQNVTLRNLSATNRRLTWDCLLEWLARDQEARFAGLLEWRHTDSDYESPMLIAADKENLVRIVLGLVEQEEQTLLREHAKKSNEHTALVEKRPKLEFIKDRHLNVIGLLLGHEVETPNDEIQLEALRQSILKKAKEWRDETVAAKAKVQNVEEEERMGNEFTNRETQLLLATVGFEEGQRELNRLQGTVYTSQQTADKQKQLDEFRELKPFRGFCSVPLEEAVEKGCTLARERKPDDEFDKMLKDAKDEAQRKEIALRRQRQECSRLATVLKKQISLRDSAKEALKKFRDKQMALMVEANKPALRAENLQEAFNEYFAVCGELEELQKSQKDLDSKKRDLDADLKRMAERHVNLVASFTRIYDHMAKFLMGDDVTATVDLRGKAIAPQLECDGPRDSTALKLAKWLAFDIGSVALSIVGLGHHPRFLLHDSPREADITGSIYHELFHAALALENAAGGEPAFQYIVTTTEPPPDDLKREPWLLSPVLNGANAKTRFLGVNL